MAVPNLPNFISNESNKDNPLAEFQNDHERLQACRAYLITHPDADTTKGIGRLFDDLTQDGKINKNEHWKPLIESLSEKIIQGPSLDNFIFLRQCIEGFARKIVVGENNDLHDDFKVLVSEASEHEDKINSVVSSISSIASEHEDKINSVVSSISSMLVQGVQARGRTVIDFNSLLFGLAMPNASQKADLKSLLDYFTSIQQTLEAYEPDYFQDPKKLAEFRVKVLSLFLKYFQFSGEQGSELNASFIRSVIINTFDELENRDIFIQKLNVFRTQFSDTSKLITKIINKHQVPAQNHQILDKMWTNLKQVAQNIIQAGQDTLSRIKQRFTKTSHQHIQTSAHQVSSRDHDAKPSATDDLPPIYQSPSIKSRSRSLSSDGCPPPYEESYSDLSNYSDLGDSCVAYPMLLSSRNCAAKAYDESLVQHSQLSLSPKCR